MGCPPPERLRSPEVLVKTAVQHSTAPTPPAHTAYTVLLSGAEPQVLPNNHPPMLKMPSIQLPEKHSPHTLPISCSRVKHEGSNSRNFPSNYNTAVTVFRISEISIAGATEDCAVMQWRDFLTGRRNREHFLTWHENATPKVTQGIQGLMVAHTTHSELWTLLLTSTRSFFSNTCFYFHTHTHTHMYVCFSVFIIP